MWQTYALTLTLCLLLHLKHMMHCIAAAVATVTAAWVHSYSYDP